MRPVEKLVTDHLDLWTAAIKRKSAAGRGLSSKSELYGIKKLRELILDLAVRGLLVPQDPCDEPVSELLKKIAAEKAKLVNEGKIKKEKPFAPIAELEKPFKLPASWVWRRLVDVFYPISVSKNKVKTSELSAHGKHPVVDQGQSFIAGYVDDDNLLNILPGPVIVFGDHTSALKYIDFNFVAGADGVKILRPLCCDERYFFLVCRMLPIESRGYGRHYSRLIDNLFPLPPLSEQHRIVAKVDELMALCDQLEQQTDTSLNAHQVLVETFLNALTYAADHMQFESAWQRASEHFDTLFASAESIEQLKQTILQLAVMGKLVPQDPSDRPASELLKGIADEKAKLVKEGKIKKEKPLSPINKKDEPYKVPQGWVWARIENATLFSEYGISAKTFEAEDGIPVIKMGDIREGKVMLGGQKKAGRDFEGIDELMLEDGDLLYNRTNSAELVGKTGIFRGPSNFYSFASYLLRIRCSSSALMPDFLNASMNSILFRKTQIEPHLKQQCGQANVNGTIMKNMIVPIPPIEEQKRIIAKLDELFGICCALKNLLDSTQTTQLYLADALTQKALAKT